MRKTRNCRWLGGLKLRVSLACFLGCHSALHHSNSFFLSPFPPGSSDEDEDDEGVSAAAFLKKKSEAPSGESRKFLKKMEVRARVTLRGGLSAVDHSCVSGEKKRQSPRVGRGGV